MVTHPNDIEALKREEIKWHFEGDNEPLSEYDKGVLDAIVITIDRLSERGLRAVLDGMVVVPREPTREMCIAGHDMQLDDGDQADIYKAMLAAAQGGER